MRRLALPGAVDLVTGAADGTEHEAGASRPRLPVLLAGVALVGVLALALSGVTRLEVERIWLPFARWTVTLCAGLPSSRQRRWLALNASTAWCSTRSCSARGEQAPAAERKARRQPLRKAPRSGS